MAKFRIMPHSRLQEWVAEEKGYFRDEELDYEFIAPDLICPDSVTRGRYTMTRLRHTRGTGR